MIYKTENELREVISLGKPEEVIDIFLESYLQGLEFEKWKVGKDLEATEEVVAGQDKNGDDIVETRLINIYEPVDVSEQVIQWRRQNFQIIRAPLYPPITMFVDAWVKNDLVEMENYRQLCLGVKASVPKA